ncbi:MAG: hypothetical protein LUD68_05865 [Rikenellaceae bacterium]|nr:hypothetical protein [Rikenellaceae bacterium]
MQNHFTISEQLERIPFLRMIIPLIAGIVLADYLSLSSGLLLGLLILLIITYFLFRTDRLRQVLLIAMIFLTGLSAAKVLTPRETMPRNERLMLSGVIEDNINTYGRWHRITALVTAFREDRDSSAK